MKSLIERIREKAITPISQDEIILEEKVSHLRDLNTETLRKKELENTATEDVLRMRKTWSLGILISIGLLVLVNITFCCSIVFKANNYSDNVILTLLTSGALEMFGLAYIVAKFLFPNSK